MMKIKNFLFLLFAIALTNCADSGIKTQRYYFPYEELEEGKVYIYKGMNEYSPPWDYWFFKSFKQNGKWFLTAQHYDGEFNVDQFQLQEILSSGAFSDSYTLYETDSLGRSQKMQAEVEFGNLFPFKVRDSIGVYLFKISWRDPVQDNKSTTLIRNRRYQKDTIYTYGGKELEGIFFRVDEVAEFDDEGILELEVRGRELYLKGIGLAYLSKNINESVRLEYKLDTIVDMDYFLEEIIQFKE